MRGSGFGRDHINLTPLNTFSDKSLSQDGWICLTKFVGTSVSDSSGRRSSSCLDVSNEMTSIVTRSSKFYSGHVLRESESDRNNLRPWKTPITVPVTEGVATPKYEGHRRQMKKFVCLQNILGKVGTGSRKVPEVFLWNGVDKSILLTRGPLVVTLLPV